MMRFLTAGRIREATWMIALAVIVVVPGAVRCAIPPPVNTIIQTTTSSGQAGQQGTGQQGTGQQGTGQQGAGQPGAPAPPPFTADSYPPGGGGGGNNSGGGKIADVPEPASLVLALVGSGLAGVVLWNRRGQQRQRSQVAV